MKSFKLSAIVFIVVLLLLPLASTACKTAAPAQPSQTTAPSATTTPAPKPVELKYAHMFPPQSPEGQVADKWAEKIAKDSNGLLTVRVYGGSTLVTAPEMKIGTKDGITDIGMAFIYKPEGNEITAVLPFIMNAPTTAIGQRVLDDVWKEFPELMNKEWSDVKVLWMNAAAPQVLFTTKKKIQSSTDLKGVQVRVPSKEMGALMEKLGGTPAYMSTADMAIGVEKGTVDGCINMYAANAAYKLVQLKYAVKLNTFSFGLPTPVFVVMNKDSWNSLHPDQQKVIENNMEWGKQTAFETWDSLQKSGLEYFDGYGGEHSNLSPEEEAKWLALYRQVEADSMKQLDDKGFPGTKVLNFINERTEYYLKQK